jgi:hypothetical protein
VPSLPFYRLREGPGVHEREREREREKEKEREKTEKKRAQKLHHPSSLTGESR